MLLSLSSRELYFQISTESTVFPTESANQLGFTDINPKYRSKFSRWPRFEKCRACVTCPERRWRLWRGMYRDEERSERAERIIKRERLKPAEVYKYDGSRRYGAQGCCRSCGMGLPKPSNQPHFCLSPTTVTHVTHVTGPRLDLWIFSFIFICFFFFFFRPSSFFLSFFSKGGEDSASEEMPTDRFRIRRWSSIFIPCS